ncbi:MAG TPA: hypothetical protein VKY19_17930 [Ktedonosporobacter sp.]|jgi:hypothetical protein|nr:hypothetical protein [Ktedonosporobacter sp.]
MEHTSGEQPGQAAIARAEVLLDNLGRRLSLFASQAGQRVQDAALAIRDQADRLNRPSTEPGEQTHSSTVAGAEEQGELALVRAEELVKRFEQQLGHYTSLASSYIQRQTARVREEGEDIWAEAQNIYRARTRTLS